MCLSVLISDQGHRDFPCRRRWCSGSDFRGNRYTDYLRENQARKACRKIVRYSENYLRACLNEHFWENENDEDLLDFSVGTIKLLKVAHTEETTTVTADIFGTKPFFPKIRSRIQKDLKRDCSCKGQDIPKSEKRTASSLPKRIARPAAPISCLMKTTAVRSAGTAYRSTMQNGLYKN